MKEVVCYLLARLGGNDKPTKEDIKRILDSVGIKPDEARLTALFEDIGKLNKSVDETIQQGMEKLAAVPSGGAAIATGGKAPAAGTGAAEAKKDDEEEEEEEEKESDAPKDLFGGGGGGDSDAESSG